MLLLVLVICLFVGGQADLSPSEKGAPLCPNSAAISWVANKNDCSSFYMCFQGRHYKYVCPSELVWNADSRRCIVKGSPGDNCTAPAQYQRPCTSGADVRESHRENCAKYYECGVIRLAGIMDPTLMECPYPLLFNDETTRCEFPESVKCNGRNEPTDPCEYDVNIKCKTADCQPCYLRLPSCKGLPEGLNPWKGKEWTPHYTVCKNERVVYTGMCLKMDDGRHRMFDPKNRTCVEPKILIFPSQFI